MTDKPNDDDLGARLAAQKQLYEEVLDTPVTEHAINFMARAQLLMDITNDPETAKEFIHTPAGREAAAREYDALHRQRPRRTPPGDRPALEPERHLAVRKLWHACEVLGFQADTLDAKHVAMTAATYLSRAPREVLNEITKPSAPQNHEPSADDDDVDKAA